MLTHSYPSPTLIIESLSSKAPLIVIVVVLSPINTVGSIENITGVKSIEYSYEHSF